MANFAELIGNLSSGLGIFSFFLDFQDDAFIRRELNDIKNSLSDIENTLDTAIDIEISDEIAQADFALNTLGRIPDEIAPDRRSDLASEAISLSDQALTGVMRKVRDVQDEMDLESLAFAFAAVHYTMLVRQQVANTVKSGPIGSAGLHRQVKEALELLHKPDETDALHVDLTDEMTYRLGNEITITEEFIVSGNSFAPGFQVQISATGSLGSFQNRLSSETFPLSFGTNPMLSPEVSSYVSSTRDEILRTTLSYEVIRAGIDDLQAAVAELGTYLAQDAINVDGLYERIGGPGNDDETGTRRADYFSGNEGDDVLTGEGGPDALSGGPGNDVLRGGELSDVLRGGAGNDMLFAVDTYGEMGTDDVARFDGRSAEFEVVGGSTYAIVTGEDGSRDKLFGFDFLRFDDGLVELGQGSALDGAGDPADFVTAERVALLYEAALNRDGNIDLPGLNFYIGVTERDNLSDEFLARDLMTSPEFTANFGDANTLSNADFLDQIYLNVLDRESDAAGRKFYLDLLDEGTISKALALADIAVSPENTAESVNVLMGLYENSAGDWSFV